MIEGRRAGIFALNPHKNVEDMLIAFGMPGDSVYVRTAMQNAFLLGIDRLTGIDEERKGNPTHASQVGAAIATVSKEVADKIEPGSIQ